MMKKQFDYKDGGEDLLLDIFDGNFDEENDWKAHQHNWPLYYHMSPLRKNIIHWFDEIHSHKQAKVLEIGGGCGAITSYLTKLDNISKITTLEGESKRAECIRKRCKNHNKLEVLTENLQNYKSEVKYDFVLIIGVLEYSGKYIAGNNPYVDFLKLAKSFLTPQGTLILAIENKLGHKYLAGMNEDHYGVPFEGVSDYPNYKGIRTFDKYELGEILNNAGFSDHKWFYPFPDYKFPKILLSDLAFNPEYNFNWIDLLDTPTVDQSHLANILFNEKQFLKSLNRNTDPSVFMNSFCIIAGPDEGGNSSQTFAMKFNNSRFQKFQKRIEFERQKNNEIAVKTKNLFTQKTKITEYHKGYYNLFELIIEAIYKKEDENVKFYMNIWIDELFSKKITDKNQDCSQKFKTFAKEKFSGVDIYLNSKEWVDFIFIDLTPYNILYNPITKDKKIIDLEWALYDVRIPLNFILDRGKYYILSKLYQLKKIKSIKAETNLWNHSFFSDNGNKVDDFSFGVFESWFQNLVYEGSDKLDAEILIKIRSDTLLKTNNKPGVLSKLKKRILSKIPLCHF